MSVKPVLLALFVTVGALLAAAPASAADSSDIHLAQAQRPATPAPAPAPSGDWLSSLRAEHVIAVGAGALAGDLLHGAIGLSGTAGILLGGVVGYYVYVNYIDKPDATGARRINAVADEARMYLIAARDAAVQFSDDLLESALLRR